MTFVITEQQKLKIALVGCGRISRNHLNAIKYHERKIDLVAICDNKKERMFEFKSSMVDLGSEDKIDDLIMFEDYETLIKCIEAGRLSIDLIILLTPSGLHCKQTIMAANVGVNVCTEKPMATNWADGLSMVKVCESAKVKLFVVKQNRFNPTIAMLKKQIAEDRFGRLAFITSNVFWQRPQSYYDQDEWRGTWKYDGGALMNQASHYVDLLEWLIGPIASVNAFLATIGRQIEVEDTISLQFRWENGAIGTMGVTMLTYPKNFEGSITVLGERGTVRIGGTALNQVDAWIFDDESEDDMDAIKSSYKTESVYGFGHVPYYRNMLNVLSGNETAMCDGNEGLKSLEIIIAAYESSRTGKTISLPLKRFE